MSYKLTKCKDCKKFYSQCAYWSTTNTGLYDDHNGDSPNKRQKHKCFKNKLTTPTGEKE